MSAEKNILRQCKLLKSFFITFLARCLKSSVFPMWPLTPFFRYGSRILTTVLLISFTNFSLCFFSTSLLVSAAAWVVFLLLIGVACEGVSLLELGCGVTFTGVAWLDSGVTRPTPTTGSVSPVNCLNSDSLLARFAALLSSFLIFSILALSSLLSLSSSSFSC